MSDEQQPGFWLRLDGTWQRLEIDALRGNIIPDWGGALSVTFLLTDPDAATEPLPLLAQRFAGDAVRYRAPTFSLEASVRLKGCERRTRTTSNRSLRRSAEEDAVVRGCSAVVDVEFDLR